MREGGRGEGGRKGVVREGEITTRDLPSLQWARKLANAEVMKCN